MAKASTSKAKTVKRPAKPAAKKATKKAGAKKAAKKAGTTKPKGVTEAQFTKDFAAKLGVSPAEARRTLDAMESTAASGLKKFGSVSTPLGKLRTKKIPAKKGGKKMFMPALGREIITKDKPAQKKVRFTAKKTFRDKV